MSPHINQIAFLKQKQKQKTTPTADLGDDHFKIQTNICCNSGRCAKTGVGKQVRESTGMTEVALCKLKVCLFTQTLKQILL